MPHISLACAVYVHLIQGTGASNSIIISPRDAHFAKSDQYGQGTVLQLIDLTIQGTLGGTLSGGVLMYLYDNSLYYDGPPKEVLQTNVVGPRGAAYGVTFMNNYVAALYLVGVYFIIGR